MDKVINKAQAKALNAALKNLSNALKRRNELVVLNNAAAAKSPSHAARVVGARSAEIDSRAEAAIAQVQMLLARSGLGGLGNPLIGTTGLIVTVTVAAAIGLAALAAIFYTNYQVQREERLYASENPVLALTRQASTAVWAVLGIGVIALGGFIYWDYRSKGEDSRKTDLDYGLPKRIAAADRRRDEYEGFPRYR